MISSINKLISQLESVDEDTASSGIDFDRLARRLVDETRTYLPSVALVVWTLEDDGALKVRLESGLKQYAVDGRFNVATTHHEQLRRCVADNAVTLEQISAGGSGPQLTAKMFPFGHDQEQGVLELICEQQFCEKSSDTIDLVGQKLSVLLSSHGVQPESRGEISTARLDQFLRLLYEQLSTRRIASVAAADGRVLAGCDRISVLLYRGRRCWIVAISHVETIQRRGGLSRAMRKLAITARHLPRPLVLEGDFSGCPENMADAFADFISESRSHSLALVPLVAQDEFDKTRHEIAHRRLKPKAALGILIVEQFTSSTDFQEALESVYVLRPHIARALYNAAEYESVLFLPLWRGLGSSVRWLLGYPKAAIFAVVATFIAVSIALALIPATYRVHADGRAMPTVQHEIYAKSDGIVKEILVAGGQRVSKGDVLIALENKELEIERVAARNKVTETTSLIESLGVRMEAARLRGDSQLELSTEGERASAAIELQGAIRRLELLQERADRLTVVSEYDGVVATFQPQELLRGRPVQQGDLVLEVMEDSGPWRLELDIAEYRMGHVLNSLNEHGALNVRYIAMTEVSSPKYAELTEVATRADHNEKLGAFVRAYANISSVDIPNQRIGAEVSAKIRCPGYSLFYCIFGDLIEFVERNIWW